MRGLGRRWAVVVAAGVVAVGIGVSLALLLSGSGATRSARSAGPARCPTDTGEALRATHLLPHIVLLSGRETEPGSAPVDYGLPATARDAALVMVELRLLPAAPLASLVPAGLVATPTTIDGHPALSAAPPKVIGPGQLSEQGRIHFWWQVSPDTVVSVTTSNMSAELAASVAEGVAYAPPRIPLLARCRR